MRTLIFIQGSWAVAALAFLVWSCKSEKAFVHLHI